MAESSTRTLAFLLTDVEGSTALWEQDPTAPQLPQELTSFIGREREVGEIQRLLRTTRLLTLTGVGGVGKTRLALRVVRDLAGAYPDGVCLVELAALADPALVPQAVASALGVREQPGRTLADTLIDVLRPRTCVLLLDNCEHLVTDCAVLADGLLRASPGLTVLATSREPLGISGETVWRVPPLGLPDASHEEAFADSASDLGRYEAVRLFEERARAALPTFELTDQNVQAVAQVCHRLDGIPLAIELAAARVRGLAPEQLAARLDDRFRLLTGGSRTALPRQRTLRALVDWSYELLSEPERILFRRLSVFAGGWTLEAAERVCDGVARDEGRGTSGDGLSSPLTPRPSPLELLLQLVDRSLVLVEQQSAQVGGVPAVRYRLLETLRQYGAERLRDAGEEAVVRARHTEWCFALAEDAGSTLEGLRGGAWAARLEAEHDNLRAALGWSLTEGAEAAGPTGQRLAAALWEFWWLHGHLTEGSRWLAAALAIDERSDGDIRPVRARMFIGAGWLAALLGNAERVVALNEAGLALIDPAKDPLFASFAVVGLGVAAETRGAYTQATALYEQSLALAQESNSTGVAGWQLGNLGRMALIRGDYERATVLLEEGLSLQEKGRDRHAASWSLQYLGRVALHQGDHERARALFEEGLAAAREVGNKLGIAWSLGNLGRTARIQGDYARATRLLEESLSVCRDVGDRWGAALSLGNLGRVALARNDYQRAAALFEENLVLCRDLAGRERRLTYALHYLGVVARELSQPERAARLFGAAQALREEAGRPMSPLDLAEHERQHDVVRRALGDEQFAAAWATGQAMSLDEAIQYALTAPPTDGRPSATRDSATIESRPSPLSAREEEVAVLLARGLSNRQIADELIISSRTAGTHVSHILNKLGLSNRSQIAAWAVEHDLAAG